MAQMMVVKLINIRGCDICDIKHDVSDVQCNAYMPTGSGNGINRPAFKKSV